MFYKQNDYMVTLSILGSHNSLSYLHVKKWWQKLATPWARCQRKTLKEQFDSGVRLFDIRLRFDKDGKAIFCHNMIEFDISESEFEKELAALCSRSEVFVRFVLDIRHKPKDAEFQKDRFFNYVKSIKRRIDFSVNNVLVFWEKKDYVNYLFDVDIIYSLHGSYSSISETFYRYLPPRMFAKIYNRQLKRLPLYSYGWECLFVDYIDLL